MSKPTIEEVKKSIDSVMFSLNMVAVYDTAKAKKILMGINLLLGGADESIKDASLGQRVTAFLTITTWFQHKGLFGSELTKYYKEIIGSFDVHPKAIKVFLEDTAKKLYRHHVEDDVNMFVKEVAPFIITNIIMKKRTSNNNGKKYTRSELAIDTIESLRIELKKIHYYGMELDTILMIRCEEIQKLLFDKRNQGCVLHAEVIVNIRQFLLHNLAETDSNLARLMI